MLQLVRWALFLPVALVASVLVGAAGNWFAEFSGASSWYIWLVSGTLSAAAFFYVAGRIAPQPSRVVKWVAVILVAGLGTMSALGSLLKGGEPVRALAGASMVILAIYQARQPLLGTTAEPHG